MYEKPQYFTPDGFRRLSTNPYSNQNTFRDQELLKKKKRAALLKGSARSGGGVTISDKAAASIAKVLKEMLNDRR